MTLLLVLGVMLHVFVLRTVRHVLVFLGMGVFSELGMLGVVVVVVVMMWMRAVGVLVVAVWLLVLGVLLGGLVVFFDLGVLCFLGFRMLVLRVLVVRLGVFVFGLALGMLVLSGFGMFIVLGLRVLVL